MENEKRLAIGLDVGTGGARAVAVNLAGRVVARGRGDLPASAVRVDGPRVEQDPAAWIAAARTALGKMSEQLPGSCEVIGLAVDATSGTFLLVDSRNQPLTPGIMYNDLRGQAEAEDAADALEGDLAPFGIRIAPAFALTKLLHFARHEPALLARCARVVHQTDWVAGHLCGRYDVTDISTALKTGAHPGNLSWPAAIEARLGIPFARLPHIVLPGTPLGEISPARAAELHLPPGTPVVAGCTDGTAGCLASGAKATGDLNVTLGTTLIFKAIADQPLIDPQGAVYNHRHPAGGYLPGAASNTGGEWIGRHLPDADLEALGRAAVGELPSGRLAYPLVKTGERFPFTCPQARGFGLDEIKSPAARFAAGMEGAAFIERLAIERLEQLGLTIGPTVYATGGGTAGATWLTIRATVTGRCYHVPAEPECAVGAAVLAAVPHLGDCAAAVSAIVHPGRQVEPDPALQAVYEQRYFEFVAVLRERGCLDSETT